MMGTGQPRTSSDSMKLGARQMYIPTYNSRDKAIIRELEAIG